MKRIVLGMAFLAGCRGCGETSNAALDAAAAESASAAPLPPPPIELRVCEGPALELLEAASAPNCAVPAREWGIAADAGRVQLAQEATRDGDAIVFSLVNRGTSPARVPLRYGKPEGAFSVLAETKKDGLFELAPPRAILEAGVPELVQSALIVLPPGGRATVRLEIDRRIVARLDRRCTDCSPATLPPDTVFHIGQTLTPLDSGPPAKVAP